MAENRLFQMVYLLLEKRRMTAMEMANYFEVSIRTIYRDIDILSNAGIPVYTIQGKGGGISIQENFVLSRSLISEQEQKQIIMALQSINIIDAENTNALLSKLGGIFQKQNLNWIEVDFANWAKNDSVNSIFNMLKSAIFQSRKVSILYCSNKGDSIKRLLEPLKIVFKSKDWYLYAYCSLREDYRLFKLTRIRELEIMTESFNRLVPLKIFEHNEDLEEKNSSITLLFDKEMSYRVYDNFDHVIENDDGRFLVKTEIPQNEWLFSFLLSFGDKVEVLFPQSIREEMRIRIEKMQNKYKT